MKGPHRIHKWKYTSWRGDSYNPPNALPLTSLPIRIERALRRHSIRTRSELEHLVNNHEPGDFYFLGEKAFMHIFNLLGY